MAQIDDTKHQILKAAMERIVHYGYAKTTMSEIAKDCDMSAGNIYRFFASKIDIAEAMARKFNEEAYETFSRLAERPGAATDRLRAFFHYDLARTYTAIAEKAKILEVAEVLASERPLFMNEQLAHERSYLSKILRDGVANGEFRPLADPNEVAEMMQSGLMKFRFPQLFSMLTLPKLQRELDGVMDLILAGLSPGATVPAAFERPAPETEYCPVTGEAMTLAAVTKNY